MLCSSVAMQMAAVAIGWQVYSIHHSAFDLGLIGLAEFAPVPLLALPAGQLADRLPRLAVVFVWGFADAAVFAPAPRRHDPRREQALAVPRARAHHGHRGGLRQPGRALARAGARARRSS